MIEEDLLNFDAPAKQRIKESVENFMLQREVKKRVEKVISKQGNRLAVTLDELRIFDATLANFVTTNPIEAINMFESHLDSHIRDMREEGGKAGTSEK
jgi:hypothetical protein